MWYSFDIETILISLNIQFRSLEESVYFSFFPFQLLYYFSHIVFYFAAYHWFAGSANLSIHNDWSFV